MKKHFFSRLLNLLLDMFDILVLFFSYFLFFLSNIFYFLLLIINNNPKCNIKKHFFSRLLNLVRDMFDILVLLFSYSLFMLPNILTHKNKSNCSDDAYNPIIIKKHDEQHDDECKSKPYMFFKYLCSI